MAMDLRSIQSPTVTNILSSVSRNCLIGKPFLHGQPLKFLNFKKYPDATKLRTLDVRAQASGTTKFSSEGAGAILNKADIKDENITFVAGATGKVGSRTVRELLKLGFRVRAGVRSAEKAQNLVKSVKQMKLDVDTASGGTEAVEKLEIVECDLEKQDQIRPALGNASVVICCIGASEKEVFDITGPYRIDYQATKNLIDAATIAKVNHFIMVSSLGTNKIGFPAAILNLFWGVLIWKRKAEEALIASGLPYTIVRPGGMERPTDAYKETHNITLSQEDTLFGGQVSNLQVAELMAFMAKNRGPSYCKVVEVIAETTAPLTPMEELLAKIPSQRIDVYSPKESGAAGGSGPASKAPSTSTEKEPLQEKDMATGPPTPTVSEDLKPTPSPSLTPETTVASETPAAPIKRELSQPTVTRPLSPYSAYEDLKPPTSPSPNPSSTDNVAKASDVDATITLSKSAHSSAHINLSGPTSATFEEEVIQIEVKKTIPVSPYIFYDDLKPPTSPSPTPPSGLKDVNVEAAVPKTNISAAPTSTSETTTGIEEEKSDIMELQTTRPLSPYAVYDDLKPPTSPSPNAPSVTPPSPSPNAPSVTPPSPSYMDGSSKMAAATIPAADRSTDEQNHAEPKLRPLSPFVMYEDLKPPASPMPPPKKY